MIIMPVTVTQWPLRLLSTSRARRRGNLAMPPAPRTPGKTVTVAVTLLPDRPGPGRDRDRPPITFVDTDARAGVTAIGA